MQIIVILGLSAIFLSASCTSGSERFALLEAQARKLRKGDRLDQVLKQLGNPDSRVDKANPPTVGIFYRGPNEGRIHLVFGDDKFSYGAIENNGKLTRLPLPETP